MIRVSSPSQRDVLPRNKWRILYSADPKSYVSLTVGRICPEIRVPPLIWSVSWGAFVPIPTFDVLVSTNRLAVPTSRFDETPISPRTSKVCKGASVLIPTFDVLVSTNRLAVPTSIFDAALNAFVTLLKLTVLLVFALVTIFIWSRTKVDA